MQGKIVDARQREGITRLTIDIYDDPGEIKAGDVDISIKPHRNSRSLDANAYHYALCNKIAQKLSATNKDVVTTKEVHAQLMIDYGFFETDELGVAKWIVLEDGKQAPDLYLYDTKHTVTLKKKSGKEVIGRVYIIVRGSHTYDSAEMSALIDGTIEEAKSLGIETITPAEKEKMMQAWKRYHG